jgi:hypothetical protein
MRISVSLSLCTNCLRDDPCCPITVAGSIEVVRIGHSASGIVKGRVLALAVFEPVSSRWCNAYFCLVITMN